MSLSEAVEEILRNEIVKINIDVAGSEKRYSFRVLSASKEMDDVYVFESAIDALSYLTIHKRDGKE